MNVELVPADVTLDDCAKGVRDGLDMERGGVEQVLNARLIQGRALLAARRLKPADQEFGAWREAQNFGFGRSWANRLCQAAEHESEVRAAVVSQLTTGKSPDFDKVVREITAEAKSDEPKSDEPEQGDPDEFCPTCKRKLPAKLRRMLKGRK